MVNNKKDFPGAYGRDLINLNFFAKIDDVIKGYRRFLRMLRKTELNKDTPVITHCYSYLKPRPVGTHFFGIHFSKGWIAQHLKHQGINDEDEQLEIVYEMFDRYYKSISALQQEFDKFLVADTRRCLLLKSFPNVEWFHDEIHPTTAGFKRVFMKICRDAKNANLWPL